MASEMDELRGYVRRAIEAGHGRPEIRASLVAAGWGEAQIARALDAWTEVPGRWPFRDRASSYRRATPFST